MHLVVENTSKAPVKLGGLVLKPGENDLTPEQVEQWKGLRAKGTSKALLRARKPRWPIFMQNLLASGVIKVVSASGADDRAALRPRGGKAKPKGKSGKASKLFGSDDDTAG